MLLALLVASNTSNKQAKTGKEKKEDYQMRINSNKWVAKYKIIIFFL
jgi:hypothetical protein